MSQLDVEGFPIRIVRRPDGILDISFMGEGRDVRELDGVELDIKPIGLGMGFVVGGNVGQTKKP